MAVTKVFTTTQYEVDAVSWNPYIPLIDALGIAQLHVYFKVSGAADSTYILLDKNSYRETFNSSSKTIDLSNASYIVDGSNIPASLSKTVHDIKLTRETSASLYISFQDGTKLSAEDINTCNLQALHRLEEEAYRLDLADSAIYAYIASQLALYYTKVEIDSFFGSLTLPNWEADRAYVVGDTVLHDDPNTTATTLLIWYCGVAHTSSTALQPTSSGAGDDYWTNVAPDTSLDNLNYLRKLPGLASTPLDWNKIKPQNANANALLIEPHNTQAAELIKITNSSGASNLLTFSLISSALGTLHLDRSELHVDMESYFGQTLGASTLFNYTGVTKTDDPIVGIRGKSNEYSIHVIDKDSTDNSTVSDNVFTISGNTNETLIWKNFKTRGDLTVLNSPQIVFGSTVNKDCYGEFVGFGGGGTPTADVRFLRSIDIGTVDNCISNNFTNRVSIDAATGNIQNNGTLTTDGTVTAAEFKDTTLANATYLSANADGVIQKETGSIPATSRLAVTVSGSDTNLANGDIVYLNNATQKWSKARADDATTLAFGVVDDVTGTSGNQGFNVVMSGAVTTTNWGTSAAADHIGNWIWLDKTTAGSSTKINPADAEAGGELVDPVGVVIAANSVYVVPARPHKTPSTAAAALGSGTSSIVNASDALITSLATNDTLKWNGTRWINVPIGSSGVTDHGALSGLADDDHSQYALADGSRGSFAASSHTHALAQITDSGTAAALDVGTTANKVVQLDGSAKLPAVDGSQLTNVSGAGGTDYLSAPLTGTWRYFDDFFSITPDKGPNDGNNQFWLNQGGSGITPQDNNLVGGRGISMQTFSGNNRRYAWWGAGILGGHQPADGDELFWESRFYFVDSNATTGMVGLGVADSIATLNANDQIPGHTYSAFDWASITIDLEQTNVLTCIKDTGGGATPGQGGVPGPTDLGGSYPISSYVDTWIRLGIHVKYNAGNSNWDIAFYINGSSVGTGSMTFASCIVPFVGGGTGTHTGNCNQNIDWISYQGKIGSQISGRTTLIDIDDV